MSCPRWTDIAFGLSGGSSRGRQEAILHLRSCGDCRSQAVERDPSLLFAGRLPGLTDSDGESQAMQKRIRAALGARKTERASPLSSRGWRLWAAAASVVAMVSALSIPLLWSDSEPEAEPTQVVAEEILPTELESLPEGDSSYATLPLVEAASSPASATVYQWPEEEMSLVMIFDQRLDV